MIEIIFKALTEENLISGIEISDIEEISEDEFIVDGETWRIMSEPDYQVYSDEIINEYIDECVLPEIPEYLQSYFDADAYIRDIDYAGDRDGLVAPHDGVVYQHKHNDDWFCFWRID
jgi:hypothetical protein